MEWTSDATRGHWLRPLLDPSWSDMHLVVPHGFEAYARVFHPVTRDRPADTKTWHGHDFRAEYGIDEEPATWADVAAARGTTMHPLAQWHLVAGVELHGGGLILDAAGWRYLEPRQGNLDPRILAGVATHLADHTTTPDVGIAAVWEGWGGQPTVVAAAPRLVLPDRAHYLFAAGVREFTDPSWTAGAPWVDDRWPNSPSILWPDDHTWVLVSEVDFDSTVVAGSRALIDALVADPTIEAHEIPEGARLDSASDTLNH